MTKNIEFVNEIVRISRKAIKIIDFIEKSERKVSYSKEIVDKLGSLIFKKFEEEVLSRQELELYRWIINNHNLAMEIQKFNYDKNLPVYNPDITMEKVVKQNEEQRNLENLKNICQILNIFLIRTKDYANSA